MIKLGLEIKNGNRAIKPQEGDVIIFDGKSWYITTKSDIFREYEQKVDAKLHETETLLHEMEDLKRQISAQMVELSETIRQFIVLQGDK